MSFTTFMNNSLTKDLFLPAMFRLKHLKRFLQRK
jgi:hypothetical protein